MKKWVRKEKNLLENNILHRIEALATLEISGSRNTRSGLCMQHKKEAAPLK